MSVRNGVQSFVYKFSVAAAATDAVTSFPISVSKGTYLISINALIACSAIPLGVGVSLQTTDDPLPASLPTVIIRNTSAAINASIALPSGAGTNQSVPLCCVYTFPADTTCYLKIGTNGVAGVDTYALTTSGVVNTVTFTQIAY
jgi:hypothetical protein